MSNVVGRNIVLLSDGTGNAAGKLFKTNVWRVYDALDLSNASQIASYDDGVGTSSIKPLAIIGGAFGWGLKRNVLALYTFLCDNYKEGDRIYAFGFSRGAFTIRVLIKLVLSEGLIRNAPSTDDLRKLALRSYRKFRADQTLRYGLHSLARPLRDFCMLLGDCILGQRRAMRDFEKVSVPGIEFLGLWDTVDAYGLPVAELGKGVDERIWPLSLNDKSNSPAIKKICHALSIDDKRTTFHPLLWEESPNACADHTDQETLTQVWFAGAHANVGGGYPDDALSYVPLRWIIKEAQMRGLIFNPLALNAIEMKVSPYGKIYNPRAGLGAYYRYDPRRLDPPEDHQGARIPLPKIHETVLWRIAMGTDGYAPLSLPRDIRIVTEGRPTLAAESRGVPSDPEARLDQRSWNILSFDAYCAAVQDPSSDLFGIPAGPAADEPSRKRAAGDFRQLTMPDEKMLELIWDTVWWRRVAYFATLACSLALLLYPMTFGNPVDDPTTNPITRAAGLATSILPEIARPWIESFQADPAVISGLVLAAIVLAVWGQIIDRRIHDRALAAWSEVWRQRRAEWLRRSIRKRWAFVALLAAPFILTVVGLLIILQVASQDTNLLIVALYLIPVLAVIGGFAAMLLVAALIYAGILWLMRRAGKLKPGEVRGLALLIAHAMRHRFLARPYRFVARSMLPPVFAAALVVVVVYAMSRISFDFMESGGWICSGRSSGEASNETVVLKTNAGCQAARKRLVANVRYEVAITDVEGWQDGDVGVSPMGAATLSIGAHKWWQLPLRRKLTAPWFVVIARVGDEGNQDYVLASDKKNVIIPKRDGNLYFFVNDAVIGLPGSDYFYADNKGTAKITVTRAGDAVAPARQASR